MLEQVKTLEWMDPAKAVVHSWCLGAFHCQSQGQTC